MHLAKISDIIVPVDGQRKEFNKNSISELADSIARLGLLHAIVLDAGEDFTIRAGRRRLLAVMELNRRGVDYQHNGITISHDSIPFTRTSDLSEEELFEVELEENIQRVDLTWQERAQAMSDLYSLLAKKQGKDLSPSEFAREVTGNVTPQETAAFRAKATSVLTLAKHLDDPDVAAAKTQKEALNIVQRKQGALLREELNRRMADAHLTPQNQQFILHHGSAFDIAPTLQTGAFDLIITDPPYGIDMDKMKTQSGSSSGHVHDYVDSEDYADDCIRLVAQEGFRVTKPSAACYMFCDVRFWNRWAVHFREAGWYVWPFPIIWNKTPVGSLLGTANGPRHVYEVILYAIKGTKGVNTVGNDVIQIPGPQQDKRHPAEKPVDIYAQLLAWSATPGDHILDFFAGCGPIFPAARQYQCYAMGIEMSDTHYHTALARANSTDELL